MGIDYRTVQVIGTDYDKLSYDNMTDLAKSLLKEEYKYHCQEDGVDYDDIEYDDLEDWYEDSFKSYFINEELNFETCGNGFSGDYYFAGVPFSVSLENTQSSIDEAVLRFKKYFNLVPEVLTDVDIY